MNTILQYILYSSDIIAMLMSAFAAYKSYQNKNKSIFIIAMLFLLGTAIRHILTGSYSTYPKELSRELWYQTFIYIDFAIFIVSFVTHEVLLLHTSRLVKWIYGLLAINVTCYMMMHWQRNVFNIHEPNWTWDVYTMIVVPADYMIAGFLIYASLKIGNKNQWLSKPQT